MRWKYDSWGLDTTLLERSVCVIAEINEKKQIIVRLLQRRSNFFCKISGIWRERQEKQKHFKLGPKSSVKLGNVLFKFRTSHHRSHLLHSRLPSSSSLAAIVVIIGHCFHHLRQLLSSVSTAVDTAGHCSATIISIEAIVSILGCHGPVQEQCADQEQ